MRLPVTLASVVVALFLARNVDSAQSDKTLTPEQAAWLKAVTDAGWTGASGVDGVSMAARDAAVFDAPLLPVLARSARADPPDVSVLDSLISVEVSKLGWLEGALVKPGKYTFGLRQDKHNIAMLLLDSAKAVINVQGVTVHGSTEAHPATSATASGDRALLTVSWGGIQFNFAYIAVTAHDRVTGQLNTANAGPVTIYTDLPAGPWLEQLAKDAAAAQPANETLLGAKLPGGAELKAYLIADEEKYKALNALAMGGKLAEQYGVTAYSTCMSYLRYFPRREPAALACGLSSIIREDMVHELHHQFALHAMPSLRNGPTWLLEGLAELATSRGLALINPAMAAEFDGKQRAELVVGAASGRVAQAEDMFAWRPGVELKTLYLGAWVLAAELDAVKGRVSALVRTVAEYHIAGDAARVARREVDRLIPSVRPLLEREAAKPAASLKRIFGTADAEGGGWRVTTEPERAGLHILPQAVKGDKLAFSGEFRWHHELGDQVDLAVGFAQGQNAQRFLKLALMPRKLVLLATEDGQWRTMATLDYDDALSKGSADKPRWHSFKVTLDAATETLRCDFADGRWGQFKLNEYWSVRGTFCGIGCYDGIAWFRGLKVEG